MRFVVATAAPVTRFVAPGPTDVVHANARSRFDILLVAREVVRELFTAFEECFAEAGDVAVAEDAKTSREEAIRLAVAFH